MEVLSQGTRFKPGKAKEIGLVDELVGSVDELVPAAKAWIKDQVGEEDAGAVLSSWGPYTSTIGQVYKKNDLSLPAVTTRAMDSTKMPAA